MTLLSKEEIVTSLSIFSLQFSIYKPDTKEKKFLYIEDAREDEFGILFLEDEEE